MEMRFLFLFSVFFSAICINAHAQMNSQKEAAYMATLYAVLNQKMMDSDIQKDLESLRQNERFVRNLQKKIDKLTNGKNSTSKDSQVRKILEQAGKDIDNLL